MCALLGRLLAEADLDNGTLPLREIDRLWNMPTEVKSDVLAVLENRYSIFPYKSNIRGLKSAGSKEEMYLMPSLLAAAAPELR